VTYRRLTVASAALAVIGLGIAAYLTYVHYRGIAPVCAIAHGCVKVQSSTWSKLAGVPVAVLGLVGYLGILLSLRVPGERSRLAAACVALTGVAFSAYLTYREVFTIKAICIWCVASAVVMLLLAVLTSLRVVLAPLDDGQAQPPRRPSHADTPETPQTLDVR
jgi:uncharacterized membrane protein